MTSVFVDPRYGDSIINDNCLLYRLTSPTWADPQYLLNGKGSHNVDGRFHRIAQTTAYVSDNILLCIAEKLYYMSISALKKLQNNSYNEFRMESTQKQVVVIFKSEEVKNLVNLDSYVALQNHQLNSTTIIYPERIYNPLQDTADKLRVPNSKCNCIVYNSARHSRGNSIALFGDNSHIIKNIEANIGIKLSLVSEDLKMLTDDQSFDPIRNKISTNMGFFSIDLTDFSNNKYLINPSIMLNQGYINFQRVYYPRLYPDSAIKR